MKTRVYLRADGHNKMGLGHIIRSLALAKMLEQEFDCQFIVRDPSPAVSHLIEEGGFGLIGLNDKVLPPHEAQFIAHHFLKGKEIIVLDGYHFDTKYQQQIRAAAGKLVCIDDIHKTHFVADAIINHTSGIQASAYSAASYTKFHLGLAYMLLRQPFLQAAQQRMASEESESVHSTAFICMGGADPNNDIIQVLQVCEQKEEIQVCNVVIGSAFLHQEALIAFQQQSRLRINIFSNLNADNMVVLMARCDFAICPPSSVALEYLCVGHQLYLLQTADNQAYLHQYLTGNGLALSWADFKSDRPKPLDRSKLDALIDGKSDRRLLKLFRELDYQIHCRFRVAHEKDMLLYFKWANEPETRAQSFHPEPIKLEDHRRWFDRKIKAPKVILYILEYKGQAVGQIRFAINGVALLSYSVDRSFRGRSLGKYLLKGGLAQLQLDTDSAINIVGYVKEENIASNRTLTSLGFVQMPSDKDSSYKYLLQAS